MSIIITNKTDDPKVTFGYCSCCFSYHELWKKDRTSKCDNTNKKLYHIPGIILYTLLFILYFVLLYLTSIK